MRNRLARALIVSFDGSVERVLERRFWAPASVEAMGTVTELRRSSTSPTSVSVAAGSITEAE
jgi:hypothetical protein